MVMDNTLIGALIVLLVGFSAIVFFNWSNTRSARRHTEKIFQQQHLVRTHPDVHRLSQAVHLLRPSVRLGFDYVIEHDEALKKVTTIDSTGYAAMRRSEYPSIEDQLDAAYKARRGDFTEQEELDNRIEQIKDKYPKSDDAL